MSDIVTTSLHLQYQNQRGGRIVLQAIAAPPKQEWGSANDALKDALDLEREVNEVRLRTP